MPPAHITKIDMASREPGLREARDAVLSALKDRSGERLLAYVDPDIVSGIALDDRSSPFWAQAQRAIENGGLLSNKRGALTFTAPYNFNLPLRGLGPLLGGDEVGLVTGDGTKLRAEPRPDSSVLRTLDWEPAAYLPLTSEDRGNIEIQKHWVRVRALDGLEGYVERDSIASGFDFRAVFAKRNGRWIITAFASGD